MGLKLLFVCTGNTCRSPMAQGLASKVLAGLDVEVSSAGIFAWEGQGASPHAVQILAEQGVDLQNHAARRLTPELMAEADWVIPMTKDQANYLKQTYPEYQDKIRCLGSWGDQDCEVSDPYGGSLRDYRRCSELIAQCLQYLKDELGKEEGLGCEGE